MPNNYSHNHNTNILRSYIYPKCTATMPRKEYLKTFQSLSRQSHNDRKKQEDARTTTSTRNSSHSSRITCPKSGLPGLYSRRHLGVFSTAAFFVTAMLVVWTKRSALDYSLASASSSPKVKCSSLPKSAPPPPSRQWNGYRIGDAIMHGYYTPDCSSTSFLAGTIACAYRNHTSTYHNISTLIHVLESYEQSRQHQQHEPNQEVTPQCYNDDDTDDTTTSTSSIVPDSTVVVVHLRLGDGLCAQHPHPTNGCQRRRPHTTLPDCWNDHADCWQSPYHYAFSREYYQTLRPALETLAATGTKPRLAAVLVSDAAHWTRTIDARNGNYTIDNVYRQNVATFSRQLGFRVQLRNAERSTTTPDDDFAYLCGATTFVQGGGRL